MDRVKIAETLRRLRRDRGETQEELADALGVTASSIGMYETGERIPRDEVKIKIAQHFNLSVGDIFFD
ncbi:MAG TPA: XRE family transcriptional regulator [Lachnospiraceae bacterium]|nr:XRE family transcriptional regulator [Lachnospiraceae bacterium]